MLVTTSADQDFDRWREMVSASFLPLRCEPAFTKEPFDATMVVDADPGLQIVRISASPHTVHREACGLGDDSCDMKISFVTEGRCRVTQGRTDSIVERGGAALYHCDSPYDLEMDRQFAKIVLQVDRREVESHTAVPTGHALTFQGDNVFMRCLRSIADELTTATPTGANVGAAAAVQQHQLIRPKMIELLALAVAGHTQGAIGSGPTRRQLFLRAVEVIHIRLRDPELSPSLLAESISVSRRSLYKLFEENGETVNEYIIRQRLEQARNELGDSTNSERTVTEIAMDLGFQSASHFSRRFAQAFAMAPSDARTI